MDLLIIFVFIFQLVQTKEILKFPDNFKFGVATSAYQIEGSWNKNGRGESMWDNLVHNHPNSISDHSTGDIADDSYNKLDDDIKNLVWLGVNHYRFSLSWTRLLPTGFSNQINPDGVRYYNELIDKLLAFNITPLVTIYHWDLPESLSDLGGWTNTDIVDYFQEFADVVFNLFGDRVKHWITINEPYQICQYGYGYGRFAPALHSDGIAPYLCGHTLLLAHAKAYHLYNRKYRNCQKGKVGITIEATWYEPKSNSTADKLAAETWIQMTFGWWAHPIFSKEGDYPKLMKRNIRRNSKTENYAHSRLPKFTRKEIKFIRGTYDFFGLNHYSVYYATAADNDTRKNWTIPSIAKDVGMKRYGDPQWIPTKVKDFYDEPWAFRKIINWIKNEYNNPEIFVTESGYAGDDILHDSKRIHYLKGYLQALLESIYIDKCNIIGYTVWTLMDNFEWNDGYTIRFGLFYTDHKDKNRTRIAKDSAKYYKYVISTRVLDNATLSKT